MIEIPFLKPNVVKNEAYLPYLDQIDISRVYSNYGPLNDLFEQRVLLEYFNNEGAVSTVNNATTGLILAISACKRKGGKYALMPSFTFSATPLAAIWAGLEPYFIDISEDNWCMNENIVKEVIEKLGDDVAVVVPYATFGTWLDLSYYMSLMNQGIPVVVDAAASFGTCLDKQFGTAFDGAIVFSFHATKAFGIGEGGLVYSSDQNLIKRIREAANFGFNGDRESCLLGLNGKTSEYTAAIALATLPEFPEKKKVRNKIREWYLDTMKSSHLQERGWRIQETKGSIAHQFFPILCPKDQVNSDLVKRLETQGIQVRHYFSPACHEQEMFRSYPRSNLSVTDEIQKRILSLPLWEEMDENHVIRVVRSLVNG
ncbi:aminotransferase class I/II-fold pyridoxal phosphate-dependent enzyme [Alicyclobacillus fastidiosus]|uniref:Aminotransferase class I/II-fold pyridoxal phosphate-dependent enzyme n=1 Tax=Alicyclobacillus fastidiosus TaxID=392011 RepID=A0ABY6ZLQ2_9BACL|nr:aminotransferase class I/II-fold pyridoxal phosphate-dependent enzyme [Alicyclobacillus fastidiosus]WAH43817.1 aminotransferase class I/II-fold pyridoxal phosphate-dependent enzyme [Alicyclobacillus fastidiosus]GMA60047.1 aminotransferase DegT [Alicyclobacillus fastidiosus]